VLGVAKGAGMIHPQMATMLAYVMTDVNATPEQLSRILGGVANRTFNRISIDGDTSTNDTLMLLASGKSGIKLEGPAAQTKFAAAVEQVCASLAEQMVRDGEGVKHLVKLTLQGARSEKEAEQIASVIATSALVKTAWAGADPNWGRILAAIGRSGVAVDISKVDIDFGELPICRDGMSVPFEETAVHAYLSQPEFEITIQLNRGLREILYLTCDLTADYVRINADYRT
jgi:glutamate N-acetyltransferase / amino-acid N-acetyltransferase